MDTPQHTVKETTTTRFVQDVSQRATALSLKPQAILAEAGVSTELWDIWSAGTFGPRAKTMDRIISVLDQMEKAK